jgi:hypothetical protein
MLWSGCSLRPLQQHPVGDLGRIEFHKSASQVSGIVVGVPHGLAEDGAIAYAKRIVSATGAALVIAYGFGSRRISVTQPLIGEHLIESGSAGSGRRGSVYPEFKTALLAAANGAIHLYVGVRVAGPQSRTQRIEVASSGISLEQLNALKEKFLGRRAHALAGSGIEAVDIALEPLDKIHWRVSGLKHHGVMLLAEKGVSIRLPARLASGAAFDAYGNILTGWIEDVAGLVTEEPGPVPEVDVAVLPHGKIELDPASYGEGVVIAAPHGTFDAYTARIVRRICARTGLPGVIATGFTPTESGDGWRINVNRPTERHGSLSEWEVETIRAKVVYEQFKDFVLRAAGGKLRLYVDIHQNGGSRIEVATVGISRKEAAYIKQMYAALRDKALAGHSEIPTVELAIEPLDEIEVGAWAAKASGILSVAPRSLHFELPAYKIMAMEPYRELYTSILSGLIAEITRNLLPVQRALTVDE